MLAALLNLPRTDADWAIWSLNNRDAIDQIRAAILAQKGVQLPTYQLDPVPLHDFPSWLAALQQSHSDFTGALGQQSSDIRDVNLNDRNELEAWIWLVYQETKDACDTLGIGP